MGIFSKIVAGGIAESVNSVGNTALKLRTALTGQSKETDADLIALSDTVAKIQGQINLASLSKSFFHSGWRPTLSWVCIFGIFQDIFIRVWIEALTAIQLPALDDRIWGLIVPLLGLGGYRTAEYIKGVIKK